MAKDKTDDLPEAAENKPRRTAKLAQEEEKPKRTPRQTRSKKAVDPVDDTQVEVISKPDIELDGAETATDGPDFFELLYGIISKPTETIRYIADKKPVVQAVLFFTAIMWIIAIAAIPNTYYQFRFMPDPTGDLAVFARVIIIGSIVAAPVLAILNLTIFSGIYHGIAKLFKGEGTYGSIVSSIGFATFPRLFEAPFSLFVLLGGRFGGSPVFFATVVFYALISWGFRIWSIFLKVIAIRETHKLSTGKATLSYIIPWAVLLTILIVFMLFIFMFIGIVASSAGVGSAD